MGRALNVIKGFLFPHGSTFGDWIFWFIDSLFALAGLVIDGCQFIACSTVFLLIWGIFGLFIWAIFNH